MWFPSQKAKDHLNDIFNLPATGNEQDWEVELSDPGRLLAFIEYYQRADHADDVRCALMALILSSFEDSKWADKFDIQLWKDVVELIKSDYENQKPVLMQWLGKGDDVFRITQLIEKIINEGSESQANQWGRNQWL